MGYIPNTPDDMREMLALLGLKSIEELIGKAVPEELLRKTELELPEKMSEFDALSESASLASLNADSSVLSTFLGAGAYDHFVPAVVRHIISRPEFYTAYTPYQAEVSQGTLQAIFEYQSLIANITAMDVSNASMYDGATALAEAALLANSHTGRNRVVVSELIHPYYLSVLKTFLRSSRTEIVLAPCPKGATDFDKLANLVDDKTSALLFQNPNFHGSVENGFLMKKAVEGKGALLIACVDPISLGLFTPPGKYGADIVVGEGQSLGIPLGFGGPYLGFFCAKEEFVRKMPGRLIGVSKDASGKRGYVMTLQTREQHIRREKATSNICTNSALCALAATVYLSILGESGFRDVAGLCYNKAHYLAEKLSEIKGVKIVHDTQFFKEFLVELPAFAEDVFEDMLEEGFLAGVPMSRFEPENKNQMLIAVTEKRSKEEMDKYVELLKEILEEES